LRDTNRTLHEKCPEFGGLICHISLTTVIFHQ
jgi:hypothetical protein